MKLHVNTPVSTKDHEKVPGCNIKIGRQKVLYVLILQKRSRKILKLQAVNNKNATKFEKRYRQVKIR